jgi:hypothetical protein
MTRLRVLIAILITFSLVVVPASVGASAAGMASIAASGVSECGVPCLMAAQADTIQADTIQADTIQADTIQADTMAGMPMPGDCNGMDGKGAPMTPSACATFCAGFVALPATHIILVREASSTLESPGVQPLLTGRADPPEPYPPRS